MNRSRIDKCVQRSLACSVAPSPAVETLRKQPGMLRSRQPWRCSSSRPWQLPPVPRLPARGEVDSGQSRPPPPLPPRTGQAIFAATCAACHGAAGEGQPNWHIRNEDGTLPAPPLNGTGHNEPQAAGRMKIRTTQLSGSWHAVTRWRRRSGVGGPRVQRHPMYHPVHRSPDAVRAGRNRGDWRYRKRSTRLSSTTNRRVDYASGCRDSFSRSQPMRNSGTSLSAAG